jgi:hypothetical protein
MEVRKLWENAEENAQIRNVCDVYGAEHLARLIGTPFSPFKMVAAPNSLCQLPFLSSWPRRIWTNSLCHA